MSQLEEKDGDVPEVEISENPIHFDLEELFGSDSDEEQVAVVSAGKDNASDSEGEDEVEDEEEEEQEGEDEEARPPKKSVRQFKPRHNDSDDGSGSESDREEVVREPKTAFISSATYKARMVNKEYRKKVTLEQLRQNVVDRERNIVESKENERKSKILTEWMILSFQVEFKKIAELVTGLSSNSTTQRDIIETLLKGYMNDEQYSIPLQLLDEQFHQRGRDVIYDFIIEHSIKESDASRFTYTCTPIDKEFGVAGSICSKETNLVQAFMSRLMEKTISNPSKFDPAYYREQSFTTQVGLLFHIMCHGTEIEHEYNLLYKGSVQGSLVLSWKSFMDQLTESTILERIETENIKLDERTRIKTLQDYEQDHKELVTIFSRYATQGVRNVFVSGILDKFFTTRFTERSKQLRDRYPTFYQSILRNEYHWVVMVSDILVLPKVVQQYDKLVHPLMQLDISDVNRELRDSVSSHSQRVFVKPETMLFPRPDTSLVTKMDIELFFEKVNNPNEIVRSDIDRDPSSPTYGRMIRVKVDLEMESHRLLLCKDYLPLLECIIMLCRRLTIITIKEHVVHKSDLTKDMVMETFMKQIERGTRLFTTMLRTIQYDTTLGVGKLMKEKMEYEQRLCISAFFSDAIDTTTEMSLFTNGLVRRANRKIRVQHGITQPLGQLDYMCRKKTEHLLVRPFTFSEMEDVILRGAIQATDGDAYFYPSHLLREKMCSSSVVVTDTNMEVDGKKFYLARYEVDPTTQQKHVYEFTTIDYHLFLPVGGLSLQSSFHELLTQKQVYLSRMYDQLDKDFSDAKLHDLLAKVLFTVASFPQRSVFEIICLCYCIITLGQSTFQLCDDEILRMVVERLSDPKTIEHILEEVQHSMIHTFYRIVFRITDEKILRYVTAFVIHRIRTTFPFLGLSEVPVQDLYLSNSVRLQMIKDKIRLPIPERPISEELVPRMLQDDEKSGRRHASRVCRYCRSMNAIPTIQWKNKIPIKIWVCEECLDKEKTFRVAVR